MAAFDAATACFSKTRSYRDMGDTKVIHTYEGNRPYRPCRSTRSLLPWTEAVNVAAQRREALQRRMATRVRPYVLQPITAGPSPIGQSPRDGCSSQRTAPGRAHASQSERHHRLVEVTKATVGLAADRRQPAGEPRSYYPDVVDGVEKERGVVTQLLDGARFKDGIKVTDDETTTDERVAA